MLAEADIAVDQRGFDGRKINLFLVGNGFSLELAPMNYLNSQMATGIVLPYEWLTIFDR